MSKKKGRNLSQSIMSSLNEIQGWTEGSGTLRVTLPGQEPRDMSFDEYIFSKAGPRPAKSWRFSTYKAMRRALEIGRKIWPDRIWNFYYVDAGIWLITVD